jgi:hypothetical protein
MQKKTTGSGGGGGREQPPRARLNAIKIIRDRIVDFLPFEVSRQRSIADSEGSLSLGKLIVQVSHAPRLQTGKERCGEREDQGCFS